MITDYQNARRVGEHEKRRAALSGRSPYLAALDDFLNTEDIAAEDPIGILEVPLDLFAGTRTRGRQNAFACNFMPLLADNSEFATKWSALYDAQINEGLRDPVKAYEYLGRFYVEEGNKRVSVMKYLGAYSIHASVIRLVPKKTEEKHILSYYEYMDFYKVTGFLGFLFSEPESYKKFAEIFGQNLKTPWPEDLLADIKSAFHNFESVYNEKGGSSVLRAEDAFLLYISIFPMQPLTSADNNALLKKHLDRVWNEFRTNATQTIRLVESPVGGKSAEELAAERRSRGLIKLLTGSPTYTKANPMRIAFIYERSRENSAWVYSHELGRSELSETFGGLVETIFFENCGTDEEIRHAIEAAIADKDQVIFTTSPSMMKEALAAALEHPEIRFLNCSVNLQVNAVRSYYARMHEAKFLMGAVAAAMSENHFVGYQANYPIYGTIAGINAFAIGAALVDPFCKVKLVWSGKDEYGWENDLLSSGVRVISGPDFIRPEDPGRRYGVYKIEDDGSVVSLAAPILDWGRYYTLIIESILNGTFDNKELSQKDMATGYWYGMSADVIDIILGRSLPYYTKKMAGMLREGIKSGRTSPFDGEIRSQAGTVKSADSERLSYRDIITMDYLNDNIIGSIPKVSEIADKARETVQAVGVRSAVEEE